MSDVLYNDNEPFAAEWLRRLIAADLIEPGDVDETSITELGAERVRGLRQFHAFAGIGVWSYALRLAGWPGNVPVWTGSCPCQPFSDAGKRRGTGDERHLWPNWRFLIQQCRPPVLFGEQVASPLGRKWLAVVQTDLEALGYLFVGADLCAAGVGAPHRRQRLFFAGVHRSWLADPNCQRREELRLQLQSGGGEAGVMGDTSSEGLEGRESLRSNDGAELETPERAGDDARGLADSDRKGCKYGPEPFRRRLASPPGGGYTRGFWAPADWLLCRDDRARPVEPESFPLAHGSSGRVVIRMPGGETTTVNRRGALRGLGNAIVPQVAAVFIRSVMDVVFS